MKKWWVKLLLAFAVILLALSTFFFKSGLDSKTRLEQYRHQLLAAGEKLSIEDHIPPRADPERNGADLFDQACRFITPYGYSLVTSNPPTAMCIVAPGKARIAWLQNEILFLKGHFFNTNTWVDLEADLTAQDPAFDLLQQAAARPEFDFGLDYHQLFTPVPQLPKLRQATALLAGKVIFDLHRGDTVSAVTNFQTLLAVANAGKDEPLLAAQSMRMHLMQNVDAIQWELLQATNITDEQLAALQRRWTNIDFIKPMEKAEVMSRSLVSLMMKEARAGNPLGGPGGPGLRMGSLFDIGGLVQAWRRGTGDTLWRQSWTYDDEVTVLQGYQVMVETMRQVETNGYFKDAFAEREHKIVALGLNRTNANWLRKQLNGHYAEVGGDFVYSIASLLDRTLAIEAWRQCAITAIALKRYQLRHGTLPKELTALVPEFLPGVPRDPVDGKPLRYRLNADGTFLLYSIGADGTDDGGDATSVPSTTSFERQTTRDWVWPQPATPQEVQNYYDHPPR